MLKPLLRLLNRFKVATGNTIDEPLAIVDRIVAGKHTEADLLLLRQIAIGKNQYLMQLGKYSVNIGQSLQEAIEREEGAEKLRERNW